MRIRFLGTHNAESKNTRLVSFLIDDVLAVDAGSLVSELTFAEQKQIKAYCFLTVITTISGRYRPLLLTIPTALLKSSPLPRPLKFSRPTSSMALSTLNSPVIIHSCKRQLLN